MYDLKKSRNHFFSLSLMFHVAAVLVLLNFSCDYEKADERDYTFDGTISREVLENYLDRSVTMAFFLVTGIPEHGREYPYREDNIRLIRNIGAKFIGRALYRWGGESRLNEPQFWVDAKEIMKQVHVFDPEIVFQGCLFEMISRDVENVGIPVGYSQKETIKRIWAQHSQRSLARTLWYNIFNDSFISSKKVCNILRD